MLDHTSTTLALSPLTCRRYIRSCFKNSFIHTYRSLCSSSTILETCKCDGKSFHTMPGKMVTLGFSSSISLLVSAHCVFLALCSSLVSASFFGMSSAPLPLGFSYGPASLFATLSMVFVLVYSFVMLLGILVRVPTRGGAGRAYFFALDDTICVVQFECISTYSMTSLTTTPHPHSDC